MDDILELHRRALAEFGGRVHAVRPDQWSCATPCVDWSVRQLVNHLVSELRWVPPLLAGATVAEVGDRFDGDLLGADPVAAWDAAAAAAAAEAARPKTVLPVAGARLTSTFGSRWGRMHQGIDLAAPMRTPEYAAADGVVLRAGAASGYGQVVYILHEGGEVTVYGHMVEILVEPGEYVDAGDTIALLGNEGRSTGPHLHFEVRVGGEDGEAIDPIGWFAERGVDV